MAEGEDRFQVEKFFNSPVTFSILQPLDGLPQLKIQLVCAMTSSWSTQRERKLARPSQVGTVVVASKFWIPTVIETVEHENKEVIGFYIDA